MDGLSLDFDRDPEPAKGRAVLDEASGAILFQA